MRTKRLLSLILACVIMLSCLLAFASCGSTENSNGEDNDSSKNTADTGSKDTDNNNNDSSTDGTTADKENNTPPANPYDAYAGKYLVYGYKTASQELDYFQVSISVHKNSYLELHNDGKLTGVISGKEIPDGNSWSVDKMIFTNPEGETTPLVIENNAILFTVNSTTMTFLKEGDSRLNDLPSVYKYLHDYITANGTKDSLGSTVKCGEGTSGVTTMTATADGKITLKFTHKDGKYTVDIPLMDNSTAYTAAMLVTANNKTCTGTFDASTVSMLKVDLITYTESSPTSGITNMYKTLFETYISLILTHTNSYMRTNLGMTIDSFGFTSYLK